MAWVWVILAYLLLTRQQQTPVGASTAQLQATGLNTLSTGIANMLKGLQNTLANAAKGGGAKGGGSGSGGSGSGGASRGGSSSSQFSPEIVDLSNQINADSSGFGGSLQDQANMIAQFTN